MDNGRYFSVRVSPGEHQFQTDLKKTGVVLDAKSGQAYYLRVTTAMGFLRGRKLIDRVGPEQGDKDMRLEGMRPIGPKDVLSKEVILSPYGVTLP